MPERYAILLLAAGLSSRFEAGDKLLHPWRGRPLLAWSAATVAAAPVAARVAVIGPHDDAKRTLLEAAGIRTIVNPDPAQGMGSSLAIGARALGDDVAGVFVALGDMPAIPADLFARLAALHARHGTGAIVAPTFEGQRGHPVLFDAAFLPQLRSLQGDEGARSVVRTAAQVHELPLADAGILRDFDTVDAFRAD